MCFICTCNQLEKQLFKLIKLVLPTFVHFLLAVAKYTAEYYPAYLRNVFW